MSKILTVVCFCLLSSSAFSQDQTPNLEKRSFIAASIGSSIPLLDFKSTNGNNSNAGFARNGTKYDILWGTDLKNRHWGITGLFRLHKNPIDESALSSAAKNKYPLFDYTIHTNDWELYTIMGGIYYRLPISKKMTIMPKAMMGMAYIYSPETNADANDNENNIATSSTGSSSTLTPSYLFSIGIKSNLYKRITLVSNFDFLFAFPSFSNVKTTYGNGAYIQRKFSPSFVTFNYGLGIGYKF